MPAVLGLDLGGTKLAIARYDMRSWRQRGWKEISSAGKPFPVIFREMKELIAAFITRDTVAIGVGVPGFVLRPEGIIRTLPNIHGAENVKLKAALQCAFRLPVTVDNDATCFTLAEARRGAGKGHSVVVGITMGTGVGGGIVIDGQPFHGSHGFAAEIGHMLLRPGDPPSPSRDKRGDVEQFLSGSAFRRRCSAAKRPQDYLQGTICSFLHPLVFREVAELIASITHLLDPDAIVFGGAVGRALKPYLPRIARELKRWVYPGTPLPQLRVTELRDAGTLGAALLTRAS
jgi:predicted NBD/HSP70 family sugar kinase